VPELSLKTGGTTGTSTSCFIFAVRVLAAVVRIDINTVTVIETREIVITTAVAAEAAVDYIYVRYPFNR